MWIHWWNWRCHALLKPVRGLVAATRCRVDCTVYTRLYSQTQRPSYLLVIIDFYNRESIMVDHYSNILRLRHVEKRCRRHTVFGFVRPWVSEWVSLCVPKTLWTPYLKKPIKGISPSFGRWCSWVHRCHVLIKFWGKKVKGQGLGRRTTPYLSYQWRQFHPILFTDVFAFVDMQIRFWGRKWTMNRKSGEYNIFVNIWANFTKIR